MKEHHSLNPYKPSGADTPSSAAPIGGKIPNERLRKTRGSPAPV